MGSVSLPLAPGRQWACSLLITRRTKLGRLVKLFRRRASVGLHPQPEDAARPTLERRNNLEQAAQFVRLSINSCKPTCRPGAQGSDTLPIVSRDNKQLVPLLGKEDRERDNDQPLEYEPVAISRASYFLNQKFVLLTLVVIPRRRRRHFRYAWYLNRPDKLYDDAVASTRRHKVAGDHKMVKAASMPTTGRKEALEHAQTKMNLHGSGQGPETDGTAGLGPHAPRKICWGLARIEERREHKDKIPLAERKSRNLNDEASARLARRTTAITTMSRRRPSLNAQFTLYNNNKLTGVEFVVQPIITLAV